jgi:hypothetical protein
MLPSMAWLLRLLAASLLLLCLGRGPRQSPRNGVVAAASASVASPPIRARIQASRSEAPIVAQILSAEIILHESILY